MGCALHEQLTGSHLCLDALDVLGVLGQAVHGPGEDSSRGLMPRNQHCHQVIAQLLAGDLQQGHVLMRANQFLAGHDAPELVRSTEMQDLHQMPGQTSVDAELRKRNRDAAAIWIQFE